MAKNKSAKAAPTNDELEAMFQGIGEEETPAKNAAAAAGAASKESSQATAAPPTVTADDEEDPLAELRTLADKPRLSSSRPGTPRFVSSTATSVTGHGKPTPPSTISGRSSEDKTEDISHAKASASQHQPAQAGGSWWGGLTSFATQAMKQAETAVSQISTNEEALKWADQVRDNYANIRGIGGNLTSRALPTFTNLLHSIAPPISQHERLQIHTTHDIIGYPSLDPMIYSTFARVMSQVEGGELLVLQRGSETKQRRPSDVGYAGSGVAGFNDGPWYRNTKVSRSISSVKGLVEGTKLVRVAAETHATEFYNDRGGLEEAAKQATAVLSESNPTRSSDIFLAIQPISHTQAAELFSGGGPSAKTEGDSVVVDEPAKPDELVTFAIFLHDPIHSINFSTLSQGIPQQWIDWLDAASTTSTHDGRDFVPAVPDAIQDIVDAGGLDPREWVSEWLEETLSLAVGSIAQRYVARRMGVGEGALGRGKRREEIVESGGGEAARAV